MFIKTFPETTSEKCYQPRSASRDKHAKYAKLNGKCHGSVTHPAKWAPNHGASWCLTNHQYSICHGVNTNSPPYCLYHNQPNIHFKFNNRPTTKLSVCIISGRARDSRGRLHTDGKYTRNASSRNVWSRTDREFNWKFDRRSTRKVQTRWPCQPPYSRNHPSPGQQAQTCITAPR